MAPHLRHTMVPVLLPMNGKECNHMFFAMTSGYVFAFVVAAFCNVPKHISDNMHSLKITDRVQALKDARYSLVGHKRSNSIGYYLVIIATNPRMPPVNGTRYGDAAILSPKRIALRVISDWNDAKLINVFLDNIIYYSPDPLRSSATAAFYDVHDYAAVRGLINIGTSSIQPCLQELAKEYRGRLIREYNYLEGNEEKMAEARMINLTHVIWSMVGFKETLRILDCEIDKIKKVNPNGAANIVKARTMFENNDYYRKMNK